MPLTKAQQIAATKSVASNKITTLTIAFIRMDSDKNMVFTNVGNEINARKLVQCMRVRLSRMRVTIRHQGKKTKDFKMHLKSYVYDKISDETEITLTKLSPAAKIDPELTDLYANIPEIKET